MSAQQTEEAQTAFLFKGGRRARLEAVDSGLADCPREFFYGYFELRDSGFPVTLIEEDEFNGEGDESAITRAATVLTHGAAGINAGFLVRAMRQGNLSLLNRYRVIVATTNNQGRALGLMRAVGRLKARVLLLAMGVLPRDASVVRRVLSRRLLREVALAPISLAEERYLQSALAPGQDMSFLPYGVDHRFWTPGPPANGAGGYVLSIGNDPRRDYATLAAAWRPDDPPLKVITRLPVPPSAGAIEVIAGDRNVPLLSDEDVRDVFRGARFVVLPLSQTIQPSGQSACMQAMACGKAVVISDIEGIWDRESVASGETCVLIPPGSVNGLRAAVDGLLREPDRAEAIGQRARAMIESSFTVDVMAARLKERLLDLLNRESPG